MAPKKKQIDQCSALIKQRNSLTANIKRIADFINETGSSLTSDELDCRLEIVETYFLSALKHQASIEEMDNDIENENSVVVRDELEELYCGVKVRIRSLMKQGTIVSKAATLLPDTSRKLPENLPKLKLPNFGGKYSEYPNFIRLFTTLVHDEYRLSTIEKFNHLLSCLSGPALTLIKTLDMVEENYAIALTMLNDRFSNKFLVCQEHIKELSHLPKINKGSADQLRSLVDTVSARHNALKTLLSPEELSNALLVQLVISALDTDSLSKIEESTDSNKTLNWNECAKILTQRCQMLESRSFINDHPQVRQSASKPFNKQQKPVALTTTNNKCSCCKQGVNHPLWKCPHFMQLSPMQRYEYAKKATLCINCLSSAHALRNCKSSSCKYCNSSHHSLLHRNHANNKHQQAANHQPQLAVSQQQNDAQNWHEATPFVPNSNASTTTSLVRDQCHVTSHSADHTILATAIVEVYDKYGQKYCAKALLDSASQLNLMTQDLAQKLNLPKSKTSSVIGGIGQSAAIAKWSTTATIKSRTSDYTTTLPFTILPAITGLQPNIRINKNSLNIPENIMLADPYFHTPQKIDILIGADVFFKLFDGQQISLGANCPAMVSTVFGWVVSGRFKIPSLQHSLVSYEVSTEPNDQLEELVKQFWELEKVPEAKHKLSKEHSECEDHFVKHVKRLDSGRFQVNLPFKCQPTVLGDSFQMATRRFLSLEKRLSANMPLKQNYVEFLEQYESDGHMTKLNIQKPMKGWYTIPHHCVLRPDKSTTKCRVVFDASAKSTTNTSLNDILKVGPVVQNDLVDILLRFRLHKYGIMADITAMYRQIVVAPEDRSVQTIVWRSKESKDLQLYQLNTVTYGTACAPYLATRCLVQLADDVQHTSPEASKLIREDFYVDDLITGGSSLQQLQEIKQNIELCLEQGGFQLHKWYSNHEQFLASLPDKDCEKTINVNGTSVVKALGIIWDAKADCFRFNYATTNNDEAVTKRNVLSELSKLFDPLGIIKPVIVKAKIFMQELWLKNISWDEPLSNDTAIAWKNFTCQLTKLNQISIPRPVLLPNTIIELHGFADASTRAYGCVFYVRCLDGQGNVKVALLTSRSKVAPISTVRSLPCLELCAAHFLTQYFLKVRSITQFKQFVFWTDSVIVLSWLKEHASNLNTFVANRVAFIQEHANGIDWKYVPSGQNPADLVSRGSTVEALQQSIWFPGPAFLYKTPDAWPKSPQTLSLKLPELKIPKTILTVVKCDILNFLHTKSNFSFVCKTVAYCRRFIQNAKSKSFRRDASSILLSANEVDAAFINLVSVIQHFYFASEIADLKHNKQVNQKSSLKTLNPFLESEHNFLLLKVGGRLKRADVPYNTKCPIILPKNDAFIEGYIHHLHQTNFHAGVQALMCKVQQRFWIIGLRDYVRKIVKRCVLCFKYKPQMSSQLMGELPKDRVTPVKPFTHCGVDFFGPIVTTTRIRSKPKYKSYVAVFICFVTRAVHMEVVSNLTSEAFIAALKRFVARRGLCSVIYCDNATNFVGARNALKELAAAFMSDHVQSELTKWCTQQGITFKHIPPRSPHFGGLWEAAVKSAKTILIKIMQSALLTFEELNTVIIQIEGMLNSRPLTIMSTDPSDERALTPAHFLNVSNSECILEPKYPFEKISSLKYWQQISALQQHFWNRWSKEVLVLLQQRHKWQKDAPNIKSDTIVMVHEDNLPPQKWIIGRVVKTIQGSDGKIRVAEIKTPAGIIRRSITKLAVLPIDVNIETP